MDNKIAIIANGTMKDADFYQEYVKDVGIIICADGGANNAYKMNIIPDYIIGDLDSIDSTTTTYFKKNHKTKIINDQNQEKTDLELAISLAESLHPDEIFIFGAIGDRIDHTLANILCLTKINPDITAKIIDEKNILELVDKPSEIKGYTEDIISVIPLTQIVGLSYEGMKWPVSNKNTKFGWFGLSNRFTKQKAKITFSKGKLLIIKVRE